MLLADGTEAERDDVFTDDKPGSYSVRMTVEITWSRRRTAAGRRSPSPPRGTHPIILTDEKDHPHGSDQSPQPTGGR
ncbi:hypothetical protein GCM10010176_050950 [Nonomuraea spiralis]|nr:hypothetical protein GCM10010176_050950 [Nonomuraea spiralis]